MRRIIGIAAIVPCLFVLRGATGRTWHVDGSVPQSGDGTSWQTAFKAIQEGIDAASDGDTIIVAEGTYLESIHFNGKNIVLTSTDPVNPGTIANTIIDGGRASCVVTFGGTEDETCVLSGFTVRNGDAETGGGICGGKPNLFTRATIENNVITSNNAGSFGGGIARCDGTVRGNRITGNSAGLGGGLANCYGKVVNNVIAENSGRDEGGGLVWCGGITANNVISGNSAHEGGGLCFCSGMIENNLIAGNVAGFGAGLGPCVGTLQDNTIVGNSAGWDGGGVYVFDGTVRNCIIWANIAMHAGPQIYSSSTPSFSCVQEWSSGGEGNISYDPLFEAAAKGDYRLQAGSPCIEGGANYFWFVWPQRDLDGNCRLVGERVDMGCYEYASAPDSDGDLVADVYESAVGTSPLSDDTDGDTLRDGLEILRGSDPLAVTEPGTVRVPSDLPTIQAALLLAIGGDEIVVSPGTYRENLLFTGADVILRSTDPQDPDMVFFTILDGGGIGPVVSFTGNETPACVLAGLKIENGAAPYAGGGICGGTEDRPTRATIRANVILRNSARYGGGLSHCAGTIEDNLICDNSAELGAGLYNCDGTIRNTVITGNSANGGGGLYSCDGEIINNTISHNSATENGGGLSHCAAAIEDNTISSNSGSGLSCCDGVIRNNVISENSGGGLYSCDGLIQANTISLNAASGLAFCRGTIRDNVIMMNSSVTPGGGLYSCAGEILDNVVGGNAGDSGGGLAVCEGSILNNSIVLNRATYSEGGGGGLYACGGVIEGNYISLNLSAASGGGLCGCHGTIRGNTIVRNIAEYNGGGLAGCPATVERNLIAGNLAGAGGGLSGWGGPIRNNAIIANSARFGGGLMWCDGAIQNNTIAHNSADELGGALYKCEGVIHNCIIWGNVAPKGSQLCESSPPAFSCIQDWPGGGEGNNSDNPLFLDRDGLDDNPQTYEDNDYRLLPDSPCIDRGDSALLLPPGLDMDGNLRIAFGGKSLGVDMGAYEFNSVPFAATEIVPDDSGGLRLTWTSQPNGIYTVWSCDSLSDPQWIQAGTVPSQGARTLLTDIPVGGTSKFYRVEMR